jgi:hypothetical protein
MTQLLADDPEIATPRNRWRGCGCIVVSCLGILIVIGLSLPMVRSAREAARRTGCGFNLRGIAQALQVYAKDHGSLPPAYTKDAEGRPLHSWRTLILPYMEEKQLFDTIDLTKPWDDPVNAPAFAKMPSPYVCPSSSFAPGHTSYVVVVSDSGCFRPEGEVTEAEFLKNASRTLLVMEVPAAQAVPWMAPSDINEEEFLRLGKDSSYESPHPIGITMAAFADTHTKTLLLGDVESLSPEMRRAMLTTAADAPAFSE